MDDIADPTDWLKTSVSGIQALETGLRCQVCKEFYNAPMVTSCGHTFCSLCIRKCLSSSQKCPTCMTTDEESRLRKNTAVQELISSFLAVRLQMLDMLAIREVEEEEEDRQIVDEGGQDGGSRRVEKRSSNGIDEEMEDVEISDRRRGKRRKQGDGLAPNGKETGGPRRSTRSSQSTSSKPLRQTPIVIDDSDSDFNPIEEHSDDNLRSSTRSKRKSTKVSDSPPEGYLKCPFCERIKEAHLLNTHANRCIEGKRSPSPSPVTANGTWSSSPLKRQPVSVENIVKPQLRLPYTEEEKQTLRMAKGNFSLAKEADVRKKLRDYGIRYDVKGKESKKVLWGRLQEWINLWNANLDSETPKTKQALIKELETSERHQVTQRPSIVQDKDFERETWGKNHKNDFDALVANARKNVTKKKENDLSTTGESSKVPQGLPMVTTQVNGIDSPEIAET
ncbi:hypothetical protein ABW20_dc0105183 [Dactylellina cionopaga]|nr:hypothetical protein ABW20_dc0105183 [Dactylellina cionopaga]